MSVVAVGEVLVDRELLEARFSCVFEACKGACCIEGELGAPLDFREEKLLVDSAARLRGILPERQRRYIRRHGCTEVYRGSLYTRTIDGGECVFAAREAEVTFCAVEMGFRRGLVADNKPLSCRLFPIRVRKKFGLDYLVYEQHAMCRDGRQQGGANDVRLIDYVGEALRELYGDHWYRSLRSFVDSSPIR